MIIAINSCKAVGLVSDDNYVLRRILFGLGNIKINSNGQKRFEQLSFFTKPKGKENSFFVPFFRDSNYEHISGVIYTSQKPLDLICGTGFQNSGITFVPNPLANHPVDLDFPYFKKLLVGEKYQELPAKKYFKNQI